MNIVSAVILCTIVGAVGAIVLVAASKFMAVEEDPRIEEVTNCLAGANCGGCGYAGCADYAKAVVMDGVPCDKCAPGGPKAAAAIAKIMGGTASAVEKKAVVQCQGNSEHCGGFFAAAILPGGSAGSFFLAFSIPAGLGTAFLYPSIQSCAQKWYAGRKGLATGVIGGAVGLSGAFLTVFVRTAVSGFGIVQGIRGAFWALGAVTLPVCLAGSLLLQDPPQDAEKQQQNDKNTIDLSPWQMLKTKQYWLCAGAVCFSTPAVLLFSPIILKLGVERGLDENAALWSVVLGSVGSAAGRLLMPMLSDKIGRRPTDLLLFAVSLGLSAGFAFAQGWWVIACYAGLTFCYSGLAAVLPALSTDLFGLPHAGVNYGFLALGQSVGSLAFPFAANLWGLEAGRHWLAVGGAAAGFAAMWVLKPAGQTPRRQDTGA